MLQEMEKTNNQKVKGAILFVYKIFGGSKNLNPETYFATGFGDAPFGSIPFGGGEVENTVLSLLRKAFINRGTVPEELLDIQMRRIEGMDLASFNPVIINPFDNGGSFLDQTEMAQKILDLFE